MNISFNGIGEVFATFLAEEGVSKGTPVKITEGCTVDACSAGESFLGFALEPRDGATAVQVGGFITAACASGCPSLGKATLAADGNGGVKSASSGVNVYVVDTDSSELTCTFYW